MCRRAWEGGGEYNTLIQVACFAFADLDRFAVGSSEDVARTHGLLRNHVLAGSHDEVGLNAVRLELSDRLVHSRGQGNRQNTAVSGVGHKTTFVRGHVQPSARLIFPGVNKDIPP